MHRGLGHATKCYQDIVMHTLVLGTNKSMRRQRLCLTVQVQGLSLYLLGQLVLSDPRGLQGLQPFHGLVRLFHPTGFHDVSTFLRQKNNELFPP